MLKDFEGIGLARDEARCIYGYDLRQRLVMTLCFYLLLASNIYFDSPPNACKVGFALVPTGCQTMNNFSGTIRSGVGDDPNLGSL